VITRLLAIALVLAILFAGIQTHRITALKIEARQAKDSLENSLRESRLQAKVVDSINGRIAMEQEERATLAVAYDTLAARYTAVLQRQHGNKPPRPPRSAADLRRAILESIRR
jgi:hypothetical protein